MHSLFQLTVYMHHNFILYQMNIQIVPLNRPLQLPYIIQNRLTVRHNVNYIDEKQA
jgi:hypothetical protein